MSEDAGNKRKAKDKAFYIKSAKQAKRSAGELGPGMKGFLCTSNREKDSVREAYNLLNEYADIIYGSEEKIKETEEKLEIEDELSKEMDDLKKQYAVPVAERRFQNVQSGIKGCVFIRTTVENPFDLVDAIISGIEKKQQQSTKFLLRMLPIQATCKSVLDDILKATESLLTEKLASYKNFSILVKIRNHSLKRDDLIQPLADMVKKKFPEIEVNLDNPEMSIAVEVLRKNCCIGIVTNYNKRAKYNLVELAQKK
nr:EOG090X0GPG [Eurycercus lamellatus]